jgi:hypothetical protein
MPRLRTIAAFIGGLGLAFVLGFVPAEAIGSLRAWASEDELDAEDRETADPRGMRRRRARQKRIAHAAG